MKSQIEQVEAATRGEIDRLRQEIDRLNQKVVRLTSENANLRSQLGAAGSDRLQL